jgi:hypothetical protein
MFAGLWCSLVNMRASGHSAGALVTAGSNPADPTFFSGFNFPLKACESKSRFATERVVCSEQNVVLDLLSRVADQLVTHLLALKILRPSRGFVL